MNREIKRDFYLEKLKEREGNGLVKVVTGIRRAGKSYLLFNLFAKELAERGVKKEQIVGVTLDGIENDALREPHALFNFIKSKIKNKKRHYVLLDEIQFVPRFHEVLNSLMRIENADIYVTGSNSRFLSADILTEFRGRGDEVRVYPLSFSEFAGAFKGTREKAWSEYLVFGGMPRLLSLKSDEQKMKYLSDLFAENYLKDIVERNKLKNSSELESLVGVLASAIGSPTNPKKLENTFRTALHSTISDKTIKNYIDFLQDAFLIESAVRFDIKGKKYISTPFKIYFADPGLRNARLGFRQIEETHLMENIIYTELRRRGCSVDVGLVETRENVDGRRERRQLEIDFVAYKGSAKYYIQSALALPDPQKKAQEERPLRAVADSFKKIIVTGSDIKLRRDESGIETVGILDFLCDENSLDS